MYCCDGPGLAVSPGVASAASRDFVVCWHSGFVGSRSLSDPNILARGRREGRPGRVGGAERHAMGAAG